MVTITLALFVTTLPLTAAPAHAADRRSGLQPARTRLGVSEPGQSSGVEMATLSIPAIGVEETVRSGVAMSVIDQGPAHWAGTSEPGGDGNVVLAGHRTTKTRPFYRVDRLEKGDLIIFSGLSSDGFPYAATYAVSEILIVEPKDVWITYETGEPIVTLFACHPKGSVRERIVIRGALVSATTLTNLVTFTINHAGRTSGTAQLSNKQRGVSRSERRGNRCKHDGPRYHGASPRSAERR